MARYNCYVFCSTDCIPCIAINSTENVENNYVTKFVCGNILSPVMGWLLGLSKTRSYEGLRL